MTYNIILVSGVKHRDSIDKWTKEVWYIHTMKYYGIKKMKPCHCDNGPRKHYGSEISQTYNGKTNAIWFHRRFKVLKDASPFTSSPLKLYPKWRKLYKSPRLVIRNIMWIQIIVVDKKIYIKIIHMYMLFYKLAMHLMWNFSIHVCLWK